MRYIKAKRRSSALPFDCIYDFGNQATIAKDDRDAGWLVFLYNDLRWCNMHGFDVRRCNNDPKILGDEDEPTK